MIDRYIHKYINMAARAPAADGNHCLRRKQLFPGNNLLPRARRRPLPVTNFLAEKILTAFLSVVKTLTQAVKGIISRRTALMSLDFDSGAS